jgi:hypothetical protein
MLFLRELLYSCSLSGADLQSVSKKLTLPGFHDPNCGNELLLKDDEVEHLLFNFSHFTGLSCHFQPYDFFVPFTLINSGLGASNFELGASNFELAVSNFEFRAPNSGLGAPNSGLRVSNFELRAPNSGLGASNSGLGAPNFVLLV